MKATITTVLTLGMMGLALATATAATVTDTFDTNHDYLTAGVSGTIWSGMVNQGAWNVLGANTPNAGTLTMALGANDVGWDASHANGPILYVTVTGDFDAAIKVAASTTGTYLNGGLIARAANTADGGPGEDLLEYCYNNFSYANITSRTLDNGAQSDNNLWAAYPFMRLARTGDTFGFYYKNTDGDSWSHWQDIARTDLAGVPLQVGLYYANYSDLDGGMQFDSFSLTTPTVPEPSALLVLGCGFLFGGRRFYRRHAV